MTSEIKTIAEQSDYLRTGRYDEVLAIAEALQRSHPDRVSAVTIGMTPEGRPMQALIIGTALTPEDAQRQGRPVLLFQGGIHPGEIEGKDAGFWFLKDLLAGRVAKGALDKLTLLFLPVFNIDGHERMTPNNRPNQNGPEEMGWRTNGLNLNLNRDYMKAESPEMAALLTWVHAWDPLLYTDMHATNGADFETDLSLLIDPADAGPEPLQSEAANLSKELIRRLDAEGHITVPFYPTLRQEDRPESGFELAPLSPRYSQSYWGARGRIGVLVETHSWRPYKHRVKTCYNVMRALTEMAMNDGGSWLKAAKATDERVASLLGHDVTLTHKATNDATMIDFKGYEYTYEYSPISNAPWVRYDRSKKKNWHVPYYGTLEADVVVRAPRGGYIVPAAFADLVARKLTLHGIKFHKIDKAHPQAKTKTFRATDVRLEAKSFEGRQQAEIHGSWLDEARDISAGTLFVPALQAKLRLALFLLEPTSPDSLLAWGFFNAAFERKEYMEAYVAEIVARDMLKDPRIKEAFEARLRCDSAFAGSSQQRLEFFYRRHPAWDERMDLYPIFQTEDTF